MKNLWLIKSLFVAFCAVATQSRAGEPKSGDHAVKRAWVHLTSQVEIVEVEAWHEGKPTTEEIMTGGVSEASPQGYWSNQGDVAGHYWRAPHMDSFYKLPIRLFDGRAGKTLGGDVFSHTDLILDRRHEVFGWELISARKTWAKQGDGGQVSSNFVFEVDGTEQIFAEISDLSPFAEVNLVELPDESVGRRILTRLLSIGGAHHNEWIVVEGESRGEGAPIPKFLHQVSDGEVLSSPIDKVEPSVPLADGSPADMYFAGDDKLFLPHANNAYAVLASDEPLDDIYLRQVPFSSESLSALREAGLDLEGRFPKVDSISTCAFLMSMLRKAP